MQQPMSQQEQMAAQQAQQQMVLCPVRLVYETQILVQPGDQIQPNQTLFMNPQNPPPWAQNRQVQQNPVIYVQQLSNNMMPTVQQHMDQQVQQQLYLQQYQNFQQILPQQMIQNPQENRQNQIHISNLLHQNMLANFQTNIGQNIQLQNIQDRSIQLQNIQDRGMQQVNFAQTPNVVGANIQMQNQGQINIPNNNMARQNEPTTSNAVQMPQQNQFNQRVEVKQSYQPNVGQISQSPNMVRTQPQVLTVNPMHNIPQAINIQAFPNINRPIKTENASSQASMPTFVNAAQNTNITRIRKVTPAPVPNMNKMNTPVNVGIRNASQPYKPIQPRPHYRHHVPNYSMEHQTQNLQTMPMITQNINPSIPATQPVVPNIHTNIQMQPQLTIKPEENSRKRKSESPDEIHKKMAAIQVNTQVPKQINKVQSTEIGTNTSPVHKKAEKLSMPLLFSNETPPESKNMATLIQNVQNAIKVDKVNMIKPNEVLKDTPPINATDKEKLVRNTVFNQARGRIFNDKELNASVVMNEITITPKLTIASKDTTTPKDTITTKDTIAPKDTTAPKDTITPKDTSIPKEEKPHINDAVKLEPDKIFKIPDPVIIQKTLNVVKTETDKPFKITNVFKSEKDEDGIKVEQKEKEMNVSLNTTNNKGMFPMDKCEQAKDFILTHVLDGIVIQESNVAFPIREPLTRRVAQPTRASNERKTRKSSQSKEMKEEEVPKEEAKEPLPVVKSDEEDKTLLKEATKGDSDSPFSDIRPATLKSWTTTELSAHLAKNKWEEIAALFQDHEIDGESLFLVSKSQLQNIGVKEEQAEIICAFVKS